MLYAARNRRKSYVIRDMKAIILSASCGSRFDPLVKITAESFLPIRGTPVIEYIISKIQLVDGLDRVYVVTNQRFLKQFNRWSDDYFSKLPIKIVDNGVCNHKDSRGSMGDLLFVLEKECINDDVLVIGGDNLFSFTLNEFVNFGRKNLPNSAIGLYSLNGKLTSKKFGVVKLAEDGRVVDFCEKPENLNGSKFISTCIYFFSKERLAWAKKYFNETKKPNKIGEYIQWLSKNDIVYGYTFSGNWFNVADADAYVEAVFTF